MHKHKLVVLCKMQVKFKNIDFVVFALRFFHTLFERRHSFLGFKHAACAVSGQIQSAFGVESDVLVIPRIIRHTRDSCTSARERKYYDVKNKCKQKHAHNRPYDCVFDDLFVLFHLRFDLGRISEQNIDAVHVLFEKLVQFDFHFSPYHKLFDFGIISHVFRLVNTSTTIF